jgi:hypothetical protein
MDYFPYRILGCKLYLLVKKYVMKKVIRLTESDLQKVIKRVIQEEEESDWWTEYGFDDKGSFLEFYYEVVEEYAYELIMEIDNEVQELLIDFFEQTGFMENVKEIVESRKKMFMEQYPQYSNVGEFMNENIDRLMTAKAKLDLEDIVEEASGSILDNILSGK